jgi:hypothetical protein
LRGRVSQKLKWKKASRAVQSPDLLFPHYIYCAIGRANCSVTVERCFNTDVFAIPVPSPQAFGNEDVGVMRGRGYFIFDFSIAKKIDVGEGRYLQFRTELFNAFNHANFGPPDIRREPIRLCRKWPGSVGYLHTGLSTSAAERAGHGQFSRFSP